MAGLGGTPYRRLNRNDQMAICARAYDSAMAVQRMEHVGLVVEDLAGAIDFFALLGLEVEHRGPVHGDWVDRIIGLEGVRAELAIMRTADGHGRIELTRFDAPAHTGSTAELPANAPGIRHISFVVDETGPLLGRLRARGFDLVGELERYENSYLLCYVRGPEGIIVELAQRIG